MCSSGDRASGKLSAEVIVKVQEDNDLAKDELKTPKYPSDELETPVVIKVRAEEILILVLVFVLWISAIILFFNRWGKIRMLEPYQPLFMDTSQRASCHISSVDNLIATRPRMSLSKYNVSCDIPSFSTIANSRSGGVGGGGGGGGGSRGRLNSVFVVASNSNHSFEEYRPRRTKSAIDIHSIKLNEMYALAKTKSTPIRIMGNADAPIVAAMASASSPSSTPLAQQRRHSMLSDHRFNYSGGILKPKLTKSFVPPNLRSYRRPSIVAAAAAAAAASSPSPSRFPFRSFDQPYDYRRSSLLASANICSKSSSTLVRSKKILDRTKTLKSFDQPSFIIESPCENEPPPPPPPADSVIVEVHDETAHEHLPSPPPPPHPPPLQKTDTVVVLANNCQRHHHHHHHCHVKKLNRSSSCTEHLNAANKFYGKNRHSADNICQM